MTTTAPRPAPAWLPTALAYIAFGVLAIKLVGVGAALALSDAMAEGSAADAEALRAGCAGATAAACGPLSPALYALLPPWAWGAIHGALAAALAYAFSRQVRLKAPTRTLFGVCAVVGLYFAFLVVVLTATVGGVCATAGLCAGATALAFGLATEGIPHPFFRRPANLFGLVPPTAPRGHA